MRKLFSILFTLFMVLPCFITAQNEVDFGIFLGYAEHGSDVHSWGRHGAMLTENSAFAYGANLKYNASKNLGLRLNYWGSKISGQDITLDKLPGHDRRNYSFTSPIQELSLVAEYDFLGKRRWPTMSNDNDLVSEDAVRFLRTISPYVFGGVGLSFTDPTVDFNGDISPLVVNDMNNTSTTNFQIPIGAGIRIDLTEKVYVGLEASSRIPLTDYLEGISESANPDKNDSYQFIGMNIGFRLGSKNDRDNDGIGDAKDECPTVPGIEAFNGCPDSDMDGIQDKDDKCPSIAGPIESMGCPDRDGDGVYDMDDLCPDTPGLVDLKGCIDSDGDGIADNLDECPEVAGLAAYKGCPTPDTDGDGFVDPEDKCPNVAGVLLGCPDTDGDGVADEIDPCPQLAGTINGCPDTDGDGVTDNIDKCPSVKGLPANEGCPKTTGTTTTKTTTTTRADIINRFVINDIYFDSNSANLKDQYRYRIDEVVAFASQFPEASFRITGHTDNSNTDVYNLSLSERRAQKVYEALVRKGLNPSKLITESVGEKQPASDNNSEEGKARNRRVEIRAYIR